VPNVLGEMGIKAEMKHNPAGLAKKVAITAAVVGTAVYLMKRRDRDQDDYRDDYHGNYRRDYRDRYR
jgi:hypothetical protein